MPDNRTDKIQERQALNALLRVMDEDALRFILSSENNGLLRDIRLLIEARTDSPAKEAFFHSEAGQALFDLTVRDYFMGEEREWNRRHITKYLSPHEEAIIAGALGEGFADSKLRGIPYEQLDAAELIALPEVEQAFTHGTEQYLASLNGTKAEQQAPISVIHTGPACQNEPMREGPVRAYDSKMNVL